MKQLSLIAFSLLISLHAPAQFNLCQLALDKFRSYSAPTSEFLETATFGPEFTFTNERLLSENLKTNSEFPERAKALLKVRSSLEEYCQRSKECKISLGSDKHGGNFRVTYTDGWYFEVGIDNGVLESQTVKSTYADFLRNKKRLERDLFQTMKANGLKPDPEAGGGHIHIGADFFHDDPVLFRNFFADYANFPQLPFGLFDSPDPNHPPIAVLKRHQQQGFAKALERFDQIENPDLKAFIWLIHSEVYTEPYKKEWGGGAYYQAIRLERMFWLDGQATFELRGFRAQKSVDELLLQLELIGARMDFLKKQGGRVPYLFAERPASFTYQSIFDSFYIYVTEAGLPWGRYRSLLPGHLKYKKASKEVVEHYKKVP